MCIAHRLLALKRSARPSTAKFTTKALKMAAAEATNPADWQDKPTIFDVTGQRINSKSRKDFDFQNYKGKVLLMVNTASKCGFTPQFEGLETLYKDVKSSHPNDFEIIGFPCNQFRNQDPDTNDEILQFCQVNYGVTFPVTERIDVNDVSAHPVWEWMKHEKPGVMGLKRIKWNFEKFLIGRDGKVRQRWASTTTPEKLKSSVLEAINEPTPTATSTAAAPAGSEATPTPTAKV